ncbi:MAG: copper resistance protein CopC [Actinobacteria bacterium]|nr:copper resistance protein CopC [Actinomycetota bacterium]
MIRSRYSRRSRLVGVLMLVGLGLVLPSTASAHSEIVATSPSGTAKTSLKRVTVTLNGPIRSGTLAVFGPSGLKVSRGGGSRDAHNFSMVSVGLKSNLVPGRYTARVGWVGADGHRQHATFGFRLAR